MTIPIALFILAVLVLVVMLWPSRSSEPLVRGEGRVFFDRLSANTVYDRLWEVRQKWLRRGKVQVGEVLRALPGGRHAIYQSNIGPVRKPYIDA